MGGLRMIHNSFEVKDGKIVECDYCGDTLEATSFDDALFQIKDNGWKSIKESNSWGHYCNKCKSVLVNLEGGIRFD